ncbi:MAG TPA: efflux RND transporter periplasmic adaptor subunit [Polyangiaceae bacterium]
MMRRLGFTHAVVLASLVLATASCSGCKKSSAKTEAQAPPGEAWLDDKQLAEQKIQVATVDEQDVDDTVLASGKVTFDDARVSHVYSPVTGKVIKIDANLGDRVKKGQELAVIDSPDISLASSDVGKAQADLTAAQHDFERQKDLYEKHAASQKDFEQSEDNYQKAKAEFGRAQAKSSLLAAGGGGAVSQGYALRAPIDGNVIARNVSPGGEVQGQYGGGSAVELFTVGETDQVWIVADVFEMDVARVQVGQKATVKVQSYADKTFDGKIDYVSGTLDPQTRTAKVRCTFDNKDNLLKPEMYATVAVSVDQRKALAIPRPAVLRLGDQTVVFVELDGTTPDGKHRFERLPVQVDEQEGSAWLPVQHGLKQGDKIVVSGAILIAGMM